MRIFVAGATGVIGRRLLPRLTQAGHEVVGMARHAAPGVVAADALDARAVREAVLAARPDVVVHQLTDLKAMDEAPAASFERTNRLRTEGTDNLLAAAREAGAERLVAASYMGWPYARHGGPEPPLAVRPVLDAIAHLERAVTAFPGGVVLRYGGFYGPGTSFGEGGAQLDAMRRPRVPTESDDGGAWRFVHVDDAAAATVAAIEGDATGILDVVDDDPAPWWREAVPAGLDPA